MENKLIDMETIGKESSNKKTLHRNTDCSKEQNIKDNSNINILPKNTDCSKEQNIGNNMGNVNSTQKAINKSI